LEYKKTRLKIDVDDVVEIIGGPFKGERGKIIRIDKAKDETTIELFEAAIPIPVTIATEFIKIIKKAKTEEGEELKQELGNKTKEV
jgi:transcription elongation factor Spt5